MARASKPRAPHPWSNITGIAFEWIGAIIAFGWWECALR
jgi:hypothetical protein